MKRFIPFLLLLILSTAGFALDAPKADQLLASMQKRLSLMHDVARFQ